MKKRRLVNKTTNLHVSEHTWGKKFIHFKRAQKGIYVEKNLHFFLEAKDLNFIDMYFNKIKESRKLFNSINLKNKNIK